MQDGPIPNGFNGEQINRYLAEIDDADDELLSLKSDHMTACKGPRSRIRNTMASAKEAGLNMAAFRTVVAAHRAERKVAAKLAELEADDASDYQAMREALGEFGNTPLGAAALDRAKPKSGDESLDSLQRQ
jgi:hypothetical protein